MDKIRNQTGKSPLFAGIISAVLPGSGYIYSGELKEGLAAFVVNGLLGVGIYSLFKNDNIGSGVLTSLVVAPFYFGNIIGSANAASNYNNRIKENIYHEYRHILNISYYFSTDFFQEMW